MGSLPDPNTTESSHNPSPSFDEFQRQTSLMTSCTLLWKELSDHFTSLEQNLEMKSNQLREKLLELDSETKISLDALEQREKTLNTCVGTALKRVEDIQSEALMILAKDPGCDNNNNNPEVDDSPGLLLKLRSYCLKMDWKGFWEFFVVRKKELLVMKAEIPKVLEGCVDPPRFVLEAISEVFPIDKRVVKYNERNGNDMGWACVLMLESLVPVMADPVLGSERLLVTPVVKDKAEEIAEIWKKELEEKGGVENVKKTSTADVHTFLQHLVTFGIVKKEDLGLYRKLVVGSAWRKQMPKLAVSLGLGDQMTDMIEELISRGQQVDAVHFTYEVGLVDKFPPVPLLKDFLKDAKKAATSFSEDPNNSGRTAHLAAKKEQSALRAVIKCIEEYKLEDEFPPENLKKRLEQLEKTKTEKKRQAEAPANKRTRASNGGPMPPAKAGRSTNAYVSSFPSPPTNAYVSSFPSPPTFVRSPSHTQYPAAVSPYPPPPAMYGPGSRSPSYTSPSYSSPSYTYSPEAASPPYAGSYPGAPMNYPVYGGYSMAPAYQQAYYR